jgi:hypothetical protein
MPGVLYGADYHEVGIVHSEEAICAAPEEDTSGDYGCLSRPQVPFSRAGLCSFLAGSS